MTKIRLLFVDDDDTFRRVMTRELADFGCETHACADAESAFTAAQGATPQVALIDLKLPGESGLQLLQRLRAIDADLQAIMLTGHGAVPEAVAAMRAGAYDFLTKPVSLDVLEQTVRRAAEKYDLLQENRRLRHLTTGDAGAWPLLGESPAMGELRSLIERVARSDGNVLVSGENGTGKELVARALHQLSARQKKPFVVVNCGAIPENLVESELFGHERGAFTGAERRRTGMFEAADGGTLFLDEIGELPLQVQPTLLRALQFGEMRPVGSERMLHVDVRIIAATNLDLTTAVQSGAFRQDLFYRIATLHLEVPPLRARPGDVALLARAFLERSSAQAQHPCQYAPEALARLDTHTWPGNVRELENAVMRLCVLATSDTITAADVDRHVLRTAARASGSEVLPTLDLEELERLAVLAAMKRHGGDKRAASAELGVSLKTLYNKLARYALR